MTKEYKKRKEYFKSAYFKNIKIYPLSVEEINLNILMQETIKSYARREVYRKRLEAGMFYSPETMGNLIYLIEKVKGFKQRVERSIELLEEHISEYTTNYQLSLDNTGRVTGLNI